VALAPAALLSWLLLGEWSSAELRGALRRSIDAVAPGVLRARLKAVLRVDVSSQLSRVQVPVLYLRASADRIVPASASAAVLRQSLHATIVEVAGPHFLLQAAPQACVEAIERFVRGSDSGHARNA
jgi:pimeloyl-ACP methyl ester carboxylesterase